MKIKDMSFYSDNYGQTKEFTNEQAFILAARNILLSRPGNFPGYPSLGMNIEKYEFSILDDNTINQIKEEFAEQAAKYMGDFSNIEVLVEKVENNGRNYIAISIHSVDFNMDANFLIGQSPKGIQILNEV